MAGYSLPRTNELAGRRAQRTSSSATASMRTAAADCVERGAERATTCTLEEQVQQPVVAAIVTSDLGVLVGRRNDGKPPWTFIAGEIEPGERPEDAAVREVKEETGLGSGRARSSASGCTRRPAGTMIYMAARADARHEVFVGDEDELAEVRWVSLAEADELAARHVRAGARVPVRELAS